MCTPRQLRFIDEYLISLNATQACIRAGYSSKTADRIGPELLGKTCVQAEITKRQAKLAAKAEITQEKVLAEYSKLAFANTLNYVRINADGLPVVDLSALTPDQAAAISEITVDQMTDKDGCKVADRVKLKLADKKGNLDSICKMLGLNAPEESKNTVSVIFSGENELQNEQEPGVQDPSA